MTKTTRKFRPVPCEVLEDRTVPNGAGWFIQGLPQQDAQAVARAVATFEKAYDHDVHTILVPTSTTAPSTTRAAFDAQVLTDLNTLDSAIHTAVSNLVGATTNTTLLAGIDADLLGAAPALQGTLTGLTTPTTGTRAVRAFETRGLVAIDRAGFQVGKLVAGATAPAGTITAQSLKSVFSAVNSGFATFARAYNSSITTTATALPAQRTAFDANVGVLLGNLNAGISTALNSAVTAGTLPAGLASSIAATVQADLLTASPASGKSLQEQLLAIRTPASNRFLPMLFFRAQSAIATGSALFQVTSDIASAVNTYNAGLMPA